MKQFIFGFVFAVVAIAGGVLLYCGLGFAPVGTATPPIPADVHGLRGRPETAISKGMFPHPPQLFQGHGVTDDAAGETYWKVANGIRLSGMPGFEKSLTDTQLWQVSLNPASRRHQSG